MTIQKFRNFDIAILSFLAILVDVIGVLFFKRAQIPMYFSISYAVVILAYVRWHKFGFIVNGAVMLTHLILFILVFDTAVGEIALHVFSLVGLSIFLGYKHIKNLKTWKFGDVILAYVLTYITVFILEFGLSNLFGYDRNIIDMFISQIFNIVFTLGILFIIFKQKTLFIDMTYYFEKREER